MLFKIKDRLKSISQIAFLFAVSSFILVNGACAHPNDPLSNDEINKVISLTQLSNLNAAIATINATMPGNIELEPANVTRPAKEVLLVERHQQKHVQNGQRLADIFTYDYERNELIESLVDLSTSKVTRTSRTQGVQLPLNNNELERAKRIVFEDEDEREILENEYQRITLRPLNDTSELKIKAFAFTAESLPNRVNEASKLCGIHRCAQLMLYTADNIVFEITPIVNLSEGVVTQRIGF